MEVRENKFYRSRRTQEVYMVVEAGEDHVRYNPVREGRVIEVQCECPTPDFEREMRPVEYLVQDDCPVGG